MFFFCRLSLSVRLYSAYTAKMNEKCFSQVDLESMTKHQLISKVLHFQSSYRQVLKQLESEPSKLDKMKNRGAKKKKEVKTIDFKQCYYRRIALKVAYLGWDYGGVQSQANVTDTIEDILRQAIRQTKLAGPEDPLQFSRCGRTDKGVSAFHQVITTRLRTRLTSVPGITRWVDPSTLSMDDRQAKYVPDQQKNENNEESVTADIVTRGTTPTDTIRDKCGFKADDIDNDAEEYDYVAILNRVLPPEIRVVAWVPVLDESFSARHDCIGREYRYFFLRGNLNIHAMNDAAKLLCGEHDFRNFGKMKVENHSYFVRKIYEFDIEELHSSDKPPNSYDMCQAKIQASGFIYHQVRNMMSVLYLIGAGFENPSVISELLDVEKNERKPSYGLSEPYPLVLSNSTYKELNWRVSAEARKNVLMHFNRYWNTAQTQATIVRELIKSIENDSTVEVDTSLTLQEVKSPVHDLHSKFPLAGFGKARKPYRRVMDLPLGHTVEEKRSLLEAKKLRLTDDFPDSAMELDVNSQ